MHYWIYAYLIVNLLASIASESYYSVVAPGTLKSNRKYTVAVTLHDEASTAIASDNTKPATVQVSIEGPSYNDSARLVIKFGETKHVNFMPPKLSNGKYILRAEGLHGVQFRNESNLFVRVETGPHIYVQLDRALYKPMDTVQFRVVILDEHTRPVNISEPIRVEILDANQNRVKQFKDIKLIHGVYTDKFQLSEHIALGSWKIIVIISGKYAYSKEKKFMVEKYVLPKFQVNIQAPDYLTPNDKIIKAIIYGKYTFDKYVEGNVTVTLSDVFGGEDLETQQLNIDGGLGSVEFKLEKYKDVELYLLYAEMSEKQTGITQSATARIDQRDQQYKIDIPSDGIEYRDNKPYLLKAKIENWNGSPVFDTQTPVIMEYGKQKSETHLNEEGVATFEFQYDPTSVHKIRYKDSKYILPYLFVDETFEEQYGIRRRLELTVMGGSPRLGKTLEVLVSSNSSIPYLVYIITSHANIVQMEYVKLPANTNSYTIQIKPTIELIPRCYLYVHYVVNGNLQYEELLIQFPFEFENQVSVTAPQQVRPGSEVTLNIKAQPNSYVCVLAVDLSVYLLDSSYDLKGLSIIYELLSDVSYTPVRSTDYPGLQSGLITLTNAHFPFQTVNTGVSPESTGSARSDERTNFPETWIFQNFEITQENTPLTLTIPDTVTTWRITAFSINSITGFGIVDEATNIVSILPFFVNLNLPYAVKKGEILSLPITVFNYHNQSLEAEVTFYNNDGEFEFIENYQNPSKRQISQSKYLMKKVKLPSDAAESVRFNIKPNVVGEISINVTGTTKLTSDAVVQKLKVEPEGALRASNKAMFLKLIPSESNVVSLRADIPVDIVAESEQLSLSLGGDTLSPTMENLNGLVMRPTGCGEQNMVNFAPNILVLQYLKSVGKLRKEEKLVTTARQFIDIGFQQELSFRHPSGGFSVFGHKKDKGEASTWLTAYVIRFFIKASKFISIQEKIITSGLDYLAKRQLDNGEFPYTGYLFYPAQQNRFGFTAFVLMTFLENKKYMNRYKDTIEKGLQFLDENIEKTKDIYALSIMAVALQMAKHSKAKNVLDKLKMQSKEENELRWWSDDTRNLEKDVEITAYIMIALLEAKEDVVKILKWLTTQRNANGGFKSTHDTVVGLQAMVKYSENFNDPNELSINLRYTAKNELGDELKTDQFLLDANNSLALQMHALPRSTRSITLEASGSGQSMLQLSSQYYVAIPEPTEHFLIEPQSELINEKILDLNICFVYQPSAAATENSNASKNLKDQENSLDNIEETFSNMVMLEINLPTGFRSDAQYSLELLENELVQRIESKKSDTLIVIYLDNLRANDKNCIAIEADKTHDAVNLKAVPVVMYDYYNTTRKNTKFYKLGE